MALAAWPDDHVLPCLGLLVQWTWIINANFLCQIRALWTHNSSHQDYKSRGKMEKVKFFIMQLLIKKNPKIFGAYCSTTWAQRNLKNDRGLRQTYFGTGETFLFSFAVRTNRDGKWLPTHYPWVNKVRVFETSCYVIKEVGTFF